MTPTNKAELVELIARAICTRRLIDKPRAAQRDDARAILTAISAAGLVVCPEVATLKMLDATIIGNLDPSSQEQLNAALSASPFKKCES